jgi:hypothetical protein
MNTQRTRRRRARCAAARTLAIAAAIAALVATLGAGQALAGPDERVLERQGRIDHQTAIQTDEQGKAEEPAKGSPTGFPRRFFKPEPPMDTSPQFDADDQVAPAPAPPPPNGPDGLVIGLAVAALLLAAVAATTWRTYHRRPRPDPTT